jgi:hypothetical protein
MSPAMDSLTLVRDRAGLVEVWEVTVGGMQVEIATGVKGTELRSSTRRFRTQRELEEWIRAEMAKQMADGFKIAEAPPAP